MQQPSADTIDSQLTDSHLHELRDRFRDAWDFGRNMLVGWRPTEDGIAVLCAPIYALPEIAARHDSLLKRNRYLPAQEDLDRLVDAGCECERIGLPFTVTATPGVIGAIDDALVEFSVTRTPCRAVALFDIVKFSIWSAFEQVTLLNSLAYSINIALARCRRAGIDIDLSMSPTGDGFYIWNKDEGVMADLALFYLLLLALSDNVIAQQKDTNYRIPVLRTCFHFGGHYEYSHAVGAAHQVRDFIVGDVTIEAARMVGGALPNQVLIGSYTREPVAADDPIYRITGGHRIDTPMFVALVQPGLGKLKGEKISGNEILGIKAYLTGEALSENEFSIKKYSITDKHGLTHKVFNVKCNILTSNEKTVYIGRQDDALAGFAGRHLKSEDIYVRIV